MGQDDEERRGVPRPRALLAGKVFVADALYSSDCVISDLSATGAKIRVSPDAKLGPPLSLLVVKDGRLFEAAVAWRSENEAGLVLRTEHDLQLDRDPARNHIRELWRSLRPGGLDL